MNKIKEVRELLEKAQIQVPCNNHSKHLCPCCADWSEINTKARALLDESENPQMNNKSKFPQGHEEEEYIEAINGPIENREKIKELLERANWVFNSNCDSCRESHCYLEQALALHDKNCLHDPKKQKVIEPDSQDQESVQQLLSDIYDKIIQLKTLNTWDDGSYETKDFDMEGCINELHNLWVNLQCKSDR